MSQNSLQRSSRSSAPLIGLDTQQFPSGFENWRSSLDHLHGMELLDALTTPNNALVCVQTLPVVDLHRYIFDIGLADADRLLALVSAEQVQQLLDIEVWNKQELSIDRMDLWLHTLMRAGHEVLYQQMLQLDDEVLTWIIKKNTYAFVVDDPESFDPPDIEHVMAADQRLCICFPREGSLDLPSKIFLDQCMRDTPEFCIYLLLVSEAALHSQIEEEAYRWRTVRMSELGFVDYYEALAIYADPPGDWKRSLAPQRIFEDHVPSKTWLISVMGPSERLDQAFAALEWEDALIVTELIAYVANMMLSADRIELWDDPAKETVLHRLRAGLHLALEVLNGPQANAQLDADCLSKYHLNYLFRLGYQQMVNSVTPIRQVRQQLMLGDDELGMLSDLPHLQPWAEALLAKHPQNLSGNPFYTQAECALALQSAQLIQDLCVVASQQSINTDTGDTSIAFGARLTTAFASHILALTDVRPLSLEEVKQFHTFCFKNKMLTKDVKERAIVWWKSVGGSYELSILALLKELSEQMSAIDPQQLDPKFIPILLCT